jgi:CRP/FNR family transcriptional regulator, cyclic AMP receptor protein
MISLTSPDDKADSGRSLFSRAAESARVASLADLDPELFGSVGPRELSSMREVGTRIAELEPGRWEPRAGSSETGLGLLVVEGLLGRTVALDREVVTELVGPGDLIRPWVTSADEDLVVPCPVGWIVLERTRLAVLGRQVASAAADCPGLMAELLERTSRRARSQGILGAIGHIKRIELRVLVLLWHIAERWGRVTADGVVVPLRLTHARIALLVGAQRPSVTAALSRLGERGLVLRTPQRGYLLAPAGRDKLETLCRRGERSIAILPQAA